SGDWTLNCLWYLPGIIANCSPPKSCWESTIEVLGFDRSGSTDRLCVLVAPSIGRWNRRHTRSWTLPLVACWKEVEIGLAWRPREHGLRWRLSFKHSSGECGANRE